MQRTMEPSAGLLSLPPLTVLQVLRNLDGPSLVALEQTNSYFSRKEPGSRLPLVEHVARQAVLHRCNGSHADAERFRHRSWRERLHMEESTGAGFDRAFSDDGGFCFQFNPDGDAVRSVRLVGMGPKLLVSDVSTREQAVLRWRLRVKGNTAVEFGVIPADLELSHTALHKCAAAAGGPHQRATGFCSQITAGSLLPLKAPVMRGTVLDVVARRGHLEVVLTYPADAKELSWHNGQPVQRPYRGPTQLRFEQDFPSDFEVRLAVTSWAKAHFEVLHSGYHVAPKWAAEAAVAQAAAAEHAAAEAQASAALQQMEEQQQVHLEAAQELLQQAPGAALQPAVPAAYEQQAALAANALLEVAAQEQAQQQLQMMVAGAVQAAAQQVAHAAAQAAAAAAAAASPFAAAAQEDGPQPLLAAGGMPGAQIEAVVELESQDRLAELSMPAPADALSLDAAGSCPLQHNEPAMCAALPAPLLLCPSLSGELFQDGHLQPPPASNT